MEGRERFTTIHAPALVIFADEDSAATGDDPQSRASAARQAFEKRTKEAQYAAFARQVLQPVWFGFSMGLIMSSVPMKPMSCVK